MAVSGLAVAMTTAGGVILWAAVRNVTPVDVVREVLGRPTAGRAISSPFASSAGTATLAQLPAGTGTLAGAGPGGDLVAEARKHIGAPYVWATAGPDRFDCSGLVVYCLRQIGVPDVPRFTTYTFGTWAASRGAVKVSPANFLPGDIILPSGLGHMGIAVGGGRMIHAPTPGQRVTEAGIWNLSSWHGWRLVKSTSAIPAGAVAGIGEK